MTPDSGWTRRQLTFGLLHHRHLPSRVWMQAALPVLPSLYAAGTYASSSDAGCPVANTLIAPQRSSDAVLRDIAGPFGSRVFA